MNQQVLLSRCISLTDDYFDMIKRNIFELTNFAQIPFCPKRITRSSLNQVW